MAERSSSLRTTAKQKYMNAWAFAVKRHIEWCPGPRGRLHWQRDLSTESTQEIVHAGDKDALMQYVEANRGELEATAKSMREAALRAEKAAREFSCPRSNAEWLAWLDSHDAEFRDLLKTVTSRRRCLNERLQPLPGGLPEAPRLGPSTVPRRNRICT